MASRPARVLVAEDDDVVRETLMRMLQAEGITGLEASTPEEALAIAREQTLGAVIQDMNFTSGCIDGEEGTRLFHDLRRLDPHLPIVVVTAFSSLEMAVELVRQGAADYLAKPYPMAKLLTTLRNLLELRNLFLDNQRLVQRDEEERARIAGILDLGPVVYRSAAMQRVLALIANITESEVPILVTGANGSGKEVIASLVHRNSPRRARPFVKVNAGGLPDELLVAELFGVEPGAYTGAKKSRAGRFELADGGTLFLDEIGNMSMEGQARLLRVLQTGEYERLGSSHTRTTNVRLISATNEHLPSAILQGRFRRDLLYRLNVIEIKIPPLAERPSDIVPLAEAFVRHHAPGRELELTTEAIDALHSHAWPGNVRELENRVRRASVLANHRIGAADLGLPDDTLEHIPEAVARAEITPRPPPSSRRPGLPAPASTPRPLPSRHAEERERIARALGQHGGVVAAAARSLGISRQALYRRMRRYGIEVQRRTEMD